MPWQAYQDLGDVRRDGVLIWCFMTTTSAGSTFKGRCSRRTERGQGRFYTHNIFFLVSKWDISLQEKPIFVIKFVRYAQFLCFLYFVEIIIILLKHFFDEISVPLVLSTKKWVKKLECLVHTCHALEAFTPSYSINNYIFEWDSADRCCLVRFTLVPEFIFTCNARCAFSYWSNNSFGYFV